MFPQYSNAMRALKRAVLPCVLLFMIDQAAAQTQPPRPQPPAPPGQGNAARQASADPGVRGGAAGVGGPLANIDNDEWRFFQAALARFLEISSVSGTIAGESDAGLGPRFNSNSCVSCHAYPAAGGSSPPTNPQISIATLHGARNVVPSFLTANGPVREARFVRNADGTPDGGVHDLFVISGRSDAGACNITQPNFVGAVAGNNVVFRIPTPMFGLGLVESTPDDHLQQALDALADARAAAGISGHFNRSANDGTITKFGWKAQNKSLMVFVGEAYNVEQGVTNDPFPNEREQDAKCQFNATPEDTTRLANVVNSSSPASDYAPDTVNFATLFRLSAPPQPAPATQQVQHGAAVFTDVGCHLCHVTTQTTGASPTASLSNVTYRPFSDFAVHDMGGRLADGITQGNANGRDWGTAPLWGLGQRVFFLHDGRTSDLVDAINIHASQGSEANAVITRFGQLSAQDQADLLVFLRSL